MKTFKKHSYLVLIAMLTVVMCLTMAFGTTAFAVEEDLEKTVGQDIQLNAENNDAAIIITDNSQSTGTADDQKTSDPDVKDDVNVVDETESGAPSGNNEPTGSVSKEAQDEAAPKMENVQDQNKTPEDVQKTPASPERPEKKEAAKEPVEEQDSAEGEGTEVKDENTSVESVNADAEETEGDEAEEQGTAVEGSAEENTATGSEEQATAVEKIGEVDLEGAAEEATEGTVNGTIESSFDYSITFTSGDKSTEVTGGQENSLSAILAGLGYEITPETVIEVDQESVDTDVINVTETVNGYVLTDNGVFGRASKNLVVYVNGEKVEIEVVDPADAGTDKQEYTVDEIVGKFTEVENGNVKLTNNITVSDGTVQTSVELFSGTHDLYLNGFTLTGNTTDPLFTINTGAILNVYGGESATDTTKSGTITGTGIALFNVSGGTLNIISGNITASGTCTSGTDPFAAIAVDSGTAKISGGTVTANGTAQSGAEFVAAIKLTNGTANVSGGSISGTSTNSYGYGIYANSSTVVTVSGGSISGTSTHSYGYGIYANSSTVVTVSGGTITSTSTNGSCDGISAINGSTVKLNGGTITVTAYKNYSNGISAINGSTVKLNGGTITSTGQNAYGFKVNDATSTGTVNGGTITSTGTNASLGISAIGGTVTVNSGTITSTGTSEFAFGIYSRAGSLIVNSGLISGTSAALIINNSSLKVYGGYFSSADNLPSSTNVNLTVNGITYNYKVGNVAKVGETKYATIAEAIDAASTKETTIELIGDSIESVTIAAGQNITLDLNGHGLYAKDNSSAVTVENNGTFTLQDSSEAKNGTVNAYGTSTSDSDPFAAITVDGGTAEIKDGSVKATGTGTATTREEYVSAIKLTNNGTVNVSGGSIIGSSVIGTAVCYGHGIQASNSTVTVSGGSITGTNTSNDGSGISAAYSTVTVSNGSISGVSNFGTGYGICAYSSTVTVSNGSISGSNSATGYGICAYYSSTVTVSGGTITGTCGISAKSSATAVVLGGTVNGTIENSSGSIAIFGGTFSEEPDDTFIAKNCSKSESGSLWTVAPDTGYAVGAVSKTGNIKAAYKTIAEAITALGTNTDGVISLLKDVQETVTIGNGTDAATLTLDLNGHVLTGTDSGSVITVNKNAALTLQDSNPTATHTGEYATLLGGVITASGTGADLANMFAAITVDGGTANITGGTVKATGTAITEEEEEEYVSAIKLTNNGTVNVSGGEISCTCTGTSSYSHGVYAMNSSTVTVSGGEIGCTCTGLYVAGVYADSSTVTVSGGNISTTGTYACGISADDGAVVTVSGGIISGTSTSSSEYNAYGIDALNGTVVTVSGGIISGTYTADTGYGISVFNKCILVVLDGTVNGNIDEFAVDFDDFIAIFGGTFNKDPSAYVATDCTPNANVPATGFWTVTPNAGYLVAAVSKTGNVKAAYTSIEAAIPDYGSYGDGVVYLLGNVNESGIIIDTNETITLDLNGKTLTGHSDYVVIDNSGTFTLTDTSATGGTITGGAIGVQQRGTMTLAGKVNITGNKMSDGTVRNLKLESGKTVTVDSTFSGSVGVTTKDTPTGGKPVAITGENSRDYSANFTSDNSSYMIINAAGDDGKSTVKLALPVCEITDGTTTKYAFVADALKAADTSETTIKMIAGTTEEITVAAGQTITLDLNGMTVSAASESGTVITNNGTLTLTDTSETGNGGVITGGAKGVEQNGTMTLAGKANITGNTGENSNLYLPSGKTVTVDSTFTGTVGVTTADAPSAGSPVAITGENTVDYSANFSSDSDSYIIINVAGTAGNIVNLAFPVCEIEGSTTTRYAYVADALTAAVTSGTTIKMIADTTENITVVSGKDIVLDLNGHVLKGTGDTKTSVITVKGKLTLNDSDSTAEHYFTYSKNGAWQLIENPEATQKTGAIEIANITDDTANGAVIKVPGGIITGGNGSGLNGGGVYVYGGTLEMNKGTIVGNTASNGGGVFAGFTKGKFTMNGGTIAGNKAGNGGGVQVQNESTFTMNNADALIVRNTANYYGGGVRSAMMGVVILENGKITGNTANEGGGVYTSEKITMTGGSITGNTANYYGGGVYVYTTGTMTVGGTAQITGNTLSDGTTASNLYLPSGKTVTVDSTFTGTVGVTTADTPVGHKPVAVTGENSADFSTCFTSDDGYVVINKKNVVKFAVYAAEVEGTKYLLLQNAINDAAEDGQTVRMLNYTIGNVTVPANSSITLDLNGKVLQGETPAYVIKVEDGADLTVTDSDPTAKNTVGGKEYDGGVIYNSNSEDNTEVVCIESGTGTVTVSSGTVAAENTGSGTAFARGIKSKGDVTVDGTALITAKTDYAAYGVQSTNGSVKVSDTAKIAAESTGSSGGSAYGIISPCNVKVSGEATVSAENTEGCSYGIYINDYFHDVGVEVSDTAKISAKSTDSSAYGIYAVGSNAEIKVSGAATVTADGNGMSYGVYSYARYTAKAEVGDTVKITVNNGSDAYGVRVNGNTESEIEISGDAVIAVNGGNAYGVYASSKNGEAEAKVGDSVTVTAEGDGKVVCGIYTTDSATVDGNAKITAECANAEGTAYGIDCNSASDTYTGKRTVTVDEEAEITGKNTADETKAYSVYFHADGTLEISDGKFTGAVGDASTEEKPVTVTGNRITGGIFTNDPSAYLNPKFKAVYDSAENVYKIVKRPVVEEQYAPEVKVEAVDVSSLNEAQQTALADLTANGTQELVNVVKASLEGAVENSDGSYTVIIKAELLKGNATSTVHVWFVNEDGTLMEVGFTVDEYGNIVILSGSLGIYFVTVDNTVVETVEKV